jgi:hypothetical protein
MAGITPTLTLPHRGGGNHSHIQSVRLPLDGGGRERQRAGGGGARHPKRCSEKN